MKYALIGCGRIGNKHIEAAINCGLDIVALCDIDINRCIDYKVKFNLSDVDFYENYLDLIKNRSAEIVAIATPSNTHYIICRNALCNNINVILEKPMAMSIMHCEKLKSFAQVHKKLLVVCHQNRYNSSVNTVLNYIKLGVLGKVFYISAQLRWNRNYSYYTNDTWRGKWKSDGGVLLNQGVHPIEIVTAIADSKASEIYGTVANFNHSYIETEDTGIGIISFENKIKAVIEATVCAYNCNFEETITIFAEKATIKIGGKSLNKIEYLSGNFNLEDKNCLTENYENIYGFGHNRLYKNIYNNLISSEKIVLDLDTAIEAIKIVLGIYKSAYINKPINMLEVDNISSSDFSDIFIRKELL